MAELAPLPDARAAEVGARSAGAGARRRWRPVRAGIRNVWEYDNQEFVFAGGRLVLRGPNGSGKSNALALLVPFLFDGVMSSNRMDSLSGGRSMRTLLLCLAEDERGRQFRHDQRTGYVWLEFAIEQEPVTLHLTIGCGARASSQRDGADAWFFVTDRRPGVDLELAPGGVPLSKGALTDALGTGRVFDSAETYRVAVDAALFGLSEHRYKHLLELLLVLRRPHLAGKLDIAALSNALSEGLPALDDRLVADVAASYEDLDAVQDDLRRLEDAHRCVQTFLPTYRRYLRATARARAEAFVEAAGTLQAARRRVAQAARAVEAADAAISANLTAVRDLETAREVAEQRRRAVLESPAYRDAASLAEVEARAHDAAEAVRRADQRLESARAAHETAASELAAAEARVTQATSTVDAAYAAAAEAADDGGIAWPVPRAEIGSADLEPVARALGRRRHQDVTDVREALQLAERAADAAALSLATANDAEEVAERADAERAAAAHALDAARDALAGELDRWAAPTGMAELSDVVDAAGSVGDPDAPSLADLAASALRPRRGSLAAAAARAEDRCRELVEERDEVAAERRRVAEDPVPAPDPVPTRPADRSRRKGAPLYACADFADHVPEGDRASLEAALEAAGLLDAWVGDLDDGLDAWLGPYPPVSGPSLADVMVPAPKDGELPSADDVRAILASISLADAGIAVSADGRYHLGPLQGRYVKPRAELIGTTAREERRRRLLAELDARIGELSARLHDAGAAQAAVGAEIDRVDAVVASIPSAADVLRARDALHGAVARAQSSRDAVERASSAERAARAESHRRATQLRTLAAERRLPTTRDGLADADDAVRRFEQRAEELVRAAAGLSDAQSRAERATLRAEHAKGTLAAHEAELDQLHRQATGLRARAEQLRAQLGADAEAPLRELAGADGEIERLRGESERLGNESSELHERRGSEVQRHLDAEQEVATHETRTGTCAVSLQVLRRGDVWSVVAPLDAGSRLAGTPGKPEDRAEEPTPGAPAEAEALAAAVISASAGESAEPDDNALQRSYRQLLDELGRGYDPSLSYVDHVALVEVTSESGTFSLLHLDRELGAQVARQRELLSERDRDIFERHLLTRVAGGLRDLLNDADELVARINRSLAERPTASGKSVQLRWEADTSDSRIRTALGLLRKTPDLLGLDEREQLRRFFSTAIAQQRAEDPAASYVEILDRVIDYRSWHAFVPYVRSAGGGVQRLTRTLYRSLSGGEQAVVLHLPLFAAAAAHYEAARPSAPRLVALDEAFAGIDEGMRAELMGLLVRFDLDMVLTGHELWGTYAQVPALMAYDLLRRPPLEGVSAVAVRWDGAAMAEV